MSAPPTRLAPAHPFSAFEPVCLWRFLGFVEVGGRDEVIAEGCSTPRHSRATDSRSLGSALLALSVVQKSQRVKIKDLTFGQPEADVEDPIASRPTRGSRQPVQKPPNKM
jgi:hypothetical protein